MSDDDEGLSYQQKVLRDLQRLSKPGALPPEAQRQMEERRAEEPTHLSEEYYSEAKKSQLVSGHFGDGEGGVQRDRLALATGVVPADLAPAGDLPPLPALPAEVEPPVRVMESMDDVLLQGPEEAAELICLIHGWPDDLHLWDDLVADLLETGDRSPRQ